MDRSRVLRVGWEAATVVWLVASLVLVVVATKQVLTGMRLAFSIERLFSSVDWVTAQDSIDFVAGEAMIRSAYWYFVLMAGMALLLIRRRWWVWLGFAMPALVFWGFGTLASDGSAFLSFLGIAMAVIVALVEIRFSIARLAREMRRPPLDGHAAT